MVFVGVVAVFRYSAYAALRLHHTACACMRIATCKSRARLSITAFWPCSVLLVLSCQFCFPAFCVSCLVAMAGLGTSCKRLRHWDDDCKRLPQHLEIDSDEAKFDYAVSETNAS